MSHSKKTPETVAKFLQRISEGRSQASVCRDEDMPSWGAIWSWVKNDPDFARDFADAKEQRGNLFGEKVAEISLALLAGKLKDSQAARVAIDGLKWSAARMAAKNFGDRMQVEHSGTSSYLDALKSVQASMHSEGVGGSEQTPEEVRTREESSEVLH